MSVRRYVRIGIAVAAVGVLGVGAAAVAGGGRNGFREKLSGYEEVPIVSTTGSGTFRAQINSSAGEIAYRVTFSGLETPITQSHIHFENATNAGSVVAFLCSSLPGKPAGVQNCPGPDATSGTIEGTITAADVGAFGTAANGIGPGEFDEFVQAIRAGATYVNIHTTGHPPGEIRAQIGDNGDD
jgi:hypothetical protein